MNNLLDTLRTYKHQFNRDFKEYKFISPAHALFFSFPKCGRTWVRFLLGKCFQLQFGLPENIDLLELETLYRYHRNIPKIFFLHDDDPFWKASGELSKSRKIYKFKRTILLVRHPADVLISAYFEKTKRYVVHGSNPGFEGSIKEYIYSSHGSTDTLIRYLNIWAKESQKINRFLLLKYEDMQENTGRELHKMIRFLNLENTISQETIDAAVAVSNFQNMQTLEKVNAYNSFRLKPGDVNDPESFKIRRGKVGGYLDYLEPSEISYIADKVNRDLDKTFGYSM